MLGTEPKLTMNQVYTWKQVRQTAENVSLYQTQQECDKPLLLVIQEKVYNVGGDFCRNIHPGGWVILSQVGQDATGAFEEFHSSDAHEMMSQFYVGDIEQSEKKSEFKRDVDQLKVEFEKKGYFKSSKVYYAFKVVSTLMIWSVAIMLLSCYSSNILLVLLSSMIMALFWQQCGWLAHDFLHHQVFQNREYNNMMGFFMGNVCQGFSVAWWKNKHFTHHSVPNVHKQDPDIDTMPFLAWSELALEFFQDVDDHTVSKFMVSHQPWLYFPLLSLARLSWAHQSILYNLPGKHITEFHRGYVGVERITLALHWAWYLGACFYYLNPMMALVYILVSQATCGILLALVFSVNHNGMPILDTEKARHVDFYELQVVTGRDVEPNLFNDWLTGGLNYQIEHHIWPTLPRHNFHKVHSSVQALCKKHNIPFHKTSLIQGVKEVVERLACISQSSLKAPSAKK